MSFKTELCLKVIGDQAYEVMSPLVYNNGIEQITVFKGFDFDGASIPKPLWGIIGSPMTGGYQRAACMHDAMYAAQLFERKVCDRLFFEAMCSEGVDTVRRHLMYWFVRMFGGKSYEDSSIEEVEKYRKLVEVKSNEQD